MVSRNSHNSNQNFQKFFEEVKRKLPLHIEDQTLKNVCKSFFPCKFDAIEHIMQLVSYEESITRPKNLSQYAQQATYNNQASSEFVLKLQEQQWGRSIRFEQQKPILRQNKVFLKHLLQPNKISLQSFKHQQQQHALPLLKKQRSNSDPGLIINSYNDKSESKIVEAGPAELQQFPYNPEHNHYRELAFIDQQPSQALQSPIYYEPVENQINDQLYNRESMSYEQLLELDKSLYNIGKGYSQDILNFLQQKNYHSEMINKNCVICQEDFETNEKILDLPCSHQFHSACISEWLQRNKKCPSCYQEIESSQIL